MRPYGTDKTIQNRRDQTDQTRSYGQDKNNTDQTKPYRRGHTDQMRPYLTDETIQTRRDIP
ncbi:hypothetical protein DPMN_104473 [Dreissena polymorpha]|uniref:Uncharacterized protein n=1 Tax=Dreissena polymorpha TaxID=45954 RepID=A0A9D4H7V4_DREPO|nr:hypothetical protein DPMN_104473 [Dreissena polymorpha]